jgi:VIT1/CCC1 family predicted Fe2+/Mn2+ transporter
MTAIADAQTAKPERLLDPVARISEILFGLIMALTFTGTLSAATAGREDVRTLLIGVIGCNIAWGLVDAVMFLMASLTERGHELATIRAVRTAASSEAARGVLAREVRPLIASIMTAQDFERLRQGLIGMGEPPPKPAITRDDWLGALAVFLLVFLSTFPVVIPFIVFSNVQLALRASNFVAIVMLFAAGYWLAGHGGYSPWRTGLSMVLLGVLLVTIAIALGG